jgi:hypothetical protein
LYGQGTGGEIGGKYKQPPKVTVQIVRRVQISLQNNFWAAATTSDEQAKVHGI